MLFLTAFVAKNKIKEINMSNNFSLLYIEANQCESVNGFKKSKEVE